MQELVFHTERERQILDITQDIQRAVKGANVPEGVCHLFVLHTSAALTTADLDNGTDLDMLDAFEEMVPQLEFRHPHNPDHVKDHIIASLLGPSLCVPIEKGELSLGVWQKIVLIEFGGPRERSVILHIS
ncbi:MAG: secondary thiamine-phosphate synthase enzyme YjbQ [Candidatus Yanofskybacteria bacterium]|nr:secondary thiamine-phosphate synthase enzyme YjbQ [Candidatus Yanofskybacteria bacterium]